MIVEKELCWNSYPWEVVCSCTKMAILVVRKEISLCLVKQRNMLAQFSRIFTGTWIGS